MKNATINHSIRQVKCFSHSPWNTRNYTALKDLQFILTRTQGTIDMKTPIRKLFMSTLKLEITHLSWLLPQQLSTMFAQSQKIIIH